MAKNTSEYQKRILALRRKIMLLIGLLILMCVLIVALIFLMTKDRGGIRGPRENQSITKQLENKKTSDIYPLFVGDSRTVGMAEAVGKDIDYHAQNGSAYGYLESLDERIRTSGSDCIVIGFGVNDLSDIKDYTDYANRLGTETDNPVFFLTVNPVQEDKAAKNGYYVKNDRIDEFNDKLKENAVNYTVIDTNDYLKSLESSSGFNTVDGLHYDNETYIKIYNYIMVIIRSLWETT